MKKSDRRNRPLLLLPVLVAMFWGSCYDPIGRTLVQSERDARAAICAFCMSLAMVIMYSCFMSYRED